MNRLRTLFHKPLEGRMTAYQTLALDFMASIKDYEADLAAERLAAGLPPLSIAQFMEAASEHLQAQFAEGGPR